MTPKEPTLTISPELHALLEKAAAEHATDARTLAEQLLRRALRQRHKPTGAPAPSLPFLSAAAKRAQEETLKRMQEETARIARGALAGSSLPAEMRAQILAGLAGVEEAMRKRQDQLQTDARAMARAAPTGDRPVGAFERKRRARVRGAAGKRRSGEVARGVELRDVDTGKASSGALAGGSAGRMGGTSTVLTEGTGAPDRLSPQQKAQAYLEWAASHRSDTPVLPLAAFDRENLYEDEA